MFVVIGVEGEGGIVVGRGEGKEFAVIGVPVIEG